ncbi:MAG: orotidine-5'-phosphate decarboxylase, partial [Planctomycetaceae bacterium]|nr:orotidine-5'-phosphate decarboxylase [Planctomycetaceae bacterium]
VAALVPAVKLQVACFERYGSYGMIALDNVIKYAADKGLVTIFDGKRGDIGSTAELYAAGILGKKSAWGADAMTVSPYMGDDSIEPFVKTATEQDAGIFVLVKTSNKGGAMFQDLQSNQKTIYQHVAQYVQELAASTIDDKNDASKYGAVGAVVGATWSKDLAMLREILKSAWLLVPGFGSQGATAEDVAAAFDENGLGAIINNSRGLLYAYKNEPYKSKYGESKWETAVESATKDMIEQLKNKTTARKLIQTKDNL